MVILEAMASACPSSRTTSATSGESCRRAAAGCALARLDGDAFTEACRRVLEDPALRDQLALRGRAASADFEAERMVERYDEVFAEACGDRRRPLPPRILHVGPDMDGRGGIPAVISDLVASPLAERHQVEFIATYGSATYGENVDPGSG